MARELLGTLIAIDVATCCIDIPAQLPTLFRAQSLAPQYLSRFRSAAWVGQLLSKRRFTGWSRFGAASGNPRLRLPGRQLMHPAMSATMPASLHEIAAARVLLLRHGRRSRKHGQTSERNSNKKFHVRFLIRERGNPDFGEPLPVGSSSTSAFVAKWSVHLRGKLLARPQAAAGNCKKL